VLSNSFSSCLVFLSNFHVLRSQTHFGRYRGRRVLFSCFSPAVSFSTVPRASVQVSCFALPDSFSTVPRSPGAVFMFCAVSGGSSPVFMFCSLELVWGGTVGVGSSFHVLHFRTRFRRYRGRQVQISCFALPDPFSEVKRVPSSAFMFCASELILHGTEGIMYCFHVLCSGTNFGRYRGLRVQFSCFELPKSFSAVPWTTSLVFMFCAFGLVLGNIEGTDFSFLGFAQPESFSAISRALCPIFKFFLDQFSEVRMASVLVFYVLRSRK
jgi:hypothetical protein